MSIAIGIDVKDTGTPILRSVSRAIRPEALGPIIGRSANNTIREHLFGLNQSRPNALGGRRTQYYAQAARSTQFQIEGDTVVVSTNQIGIAQRYYGGTIKPKTAKFLTIPVHPAAYGKRAREFDLELVFGHGGQPIALATKASGSVSTLDSRGRIRKGHGFGEIYFRLAKSITQQADPTVLPYDELVESRIDKDVASFLDRAAQRTGGATS